MMSNFQWNHQQKPNNIHQKKWAHLGSSKKTSGLRFRNLEAFNLAILVKKLWRVLKNVETLMAETLKYKYFKNTHLLEATVGLRPSFIWRSFCSAMDLLKEGLYWRLGLGDQIKIWEHKWIPSPSTFKVQLLMRILSMDATVKDLIDISMGKTSHFSDFKSTRDRGYS